MAEKILEQQPNLRGKLRFYVMKGTEVNAFATDMGIIFVNVGLLANLQNEAELAFVLCHEITHYTERHGMEGYIETQDIRDGRGAYRGQSEERRLMARHAYSRDQETEADVEGLELYAKTQYSYKALQGAFDMLAESGLPFADYPFDTSRWFNVGGIRIPESRWPEIDSIVLDEDEDDSQRTHPNIKKRRRAVEDALEGRSNEGRKFFLNSREDFNAMRDLARFEQARLYMLNSQYTEAIYAANLIAQDYPTNPYPREVIGKCLYAMARFKNEGRTYELFDDYDNDSRKPMGHFSSLFKYLKEGSAAELTMLAVRYLQGLQKQYPNDSTYTQMLDDLYMDLAWNHESFLERLYEAQTRPVTVDTTTASDSTENNEEIAYTRNRSTRSSIGNASRTSASGTNNGDKPIDTSVRNRERRNRDETRVNLQYMYRAFDGDTAAYNAFKATMTAKKREVERRRQEAEADSRNRRGQSRTQRRNAIDAPSLKTATYDELQARRIAVVNPSYNVYDLRKREAVRYLDAEQQRGEFVEMLTNIGQENGLTVNMLNVKNMNAAELQRFNDMAYLREWAQERMSHVGVFMRNFEQDRVDSVTKRLGADLIAFVGLNTITKPREGKGLMVAFTILYIGIPLPYCIYYLATPTVATQYTAIVLDSENGRVVNVHSHVTRLRDRSDVRKSMVDFWYRILKTNR